MVLGRLSISFTAMKRTLVAISSKHHLLLCLTTVWNPPHPSPCHYASLPPPTSTESLVFVSQLLVLSHQESYCFKVFGNFLRLLMELGNHIQMQISKLLL